MKKGSKVFILLARKVMAAYLRYHMAKAKITTLFEVIKSVLKACVLSSLKLLLAYP